MTITDFPFAVLRLQYRIARTPLQLFESSVISRMDTEAPRRLMFERAVGSIDATVGNLLRDRDLEQSGITRIERAVELAEAARLDEVADQKKRQAGDELKEKRDQAVAAPQKAREEAKERVQEARAEAEQGKRQAAENVAKRTSQAKEQIDQSAQQRKQNAEKAKQNVQNRSRAAEKAEVKVAEKQLDDAADKRSAAVGARAHADKLEDYSETEKLKRQAAADKP